MQLKGIFPGHCASIDKQCINQLLVFLLTLPLINHVLALIVFIAAIMVFRSKFACHGFHNRGRRVRTVVAAVERGGKTGPN